MTTNGRDDLREDEEDRLARLFYECSALAGLVLSPAGCVLEANRHAAALLGVELESLRGQHLIDFVDPDFRPTFRQHLDQIDPHAGVTTAELAFHGGDERDFHALLASRVAEFRGRKVLLTNMTDLSRLQTTSTPQSWLRAELRQTQKMAALGQLASGIAHDFNNLLTLITGYSSVLLSQTPAHAVERDPLEKITRASKQAADLVGQLLAFGRDSGPNSAVLSLNDVLIDFDAMLERIIGDEIELQILLDPQLGNIRINPNQLDQVLMNLAINARDAMAHGGTLTFETDNVYLDDERPAQLAGLPAGPYIRLRITDTGCGIPAEALPRIFEPFFTTKQAGRGTGLGLATTANIVRQHGGAILVDSAPGEGTTFELYFPDAEASIDQLQEAPDGAEELPGSAHVLLVDDHTEVRRLSARILRRHGFRVTQAGDASAALEMSAEVDRRFDLAAVDTGIGTSKIDELVDRLRANFPRLGLLLISGSQANPERRGGDAVLCKPYTPAQLVRELGELHDEGDS